MKLKCFIKKGFPLKVFFFEQFCAVPCKFACKFRKICTYTSFAEAKEKDWQKSLINKAHIFLLLKNLPIVTERCTVHVTIFAILILFYFVNGDLISDRTSLPNVEDTGNKMFAG